MELFRFAERYFFRYTLFTHKLTNDICFIKLIKLYSGSVYKGGNRNASGEVIMQMFPLVPTMMPLTIST